MMFYWLKCWHDYLLFVWRDNFRFGRWWIILCSASSLVFAFEIILVAATHCNEDVLDLPIAALFCGLGGFAEAVRRSLDRK